VRRALDCLALGHWSGQAPFPGKNPAKAAPLARTAAAQNHPADCKRGTRSYCSDPGPAP